LKNLALNIGIRVCIIVMLAVLFALVLVSMEMLFAPLVFGILLAVATIELIGYINRSGKELTRMLLSLRQGAFTDVFMKPGARQHIEVSKALNEVIQEFARVSLDKELHYQYLSALNENINVAILSFDEHGSLLMMNPEAKKLLNTPVIAQLSDLRSIDENLHRTVSEIRPPEKRTIRAFIDEQALQLSVHVKEIIISGKLIRIVLIQNISSELETKEVEAWESLTKELTHEIMNSVTPIASLTDAVRSLIRNPDGSARNFSNLDGDSVADIHTSIDTIAHRSKGLLRFISSYKEFSKNPELRLEEINVADVLRRVVDLLGPTMEKSSIRISLNLSRPTLKMSADPGLIEQVLINIVKNAIEAVSHAGSGVIGIYAKKPDESSVSIAVSDNGPGMDADTLSRIFIPFFTTKTNGTGIGLSLSRKIMKLHHGAIRVQSSPGEGSIFTIEWKNQ
jgi:two-component system, NtrC family, nitrogen regulation sensor histidine kinase NtrY